MNIKSIYGAICAFLLVMSFSTMANAAIVTWTIENAFFDDGSSITGSFDYDASTNIYSDINIVTDSWTSGNLGWVYSSTPDFIIIGDANDLEITDDVNGPVIAFSWFTPLTDAGGVVGIEVNGTFEEDGFSNDLRILEPGTGSVVTASVVPVPAAVWLFGSGLLGLIGFARRRKA